MMMRVRREALSELDMPTIEELASRRNGDEHRSVRVLGNADARGSRDSTLCHVPSFTRTSARRGT